MTDHSDRGRFVWHELMTPNPSGARDFYANVVGWKVEASAPDDSHATFAGPTGPLGGCTTQSPTASPQWVPFVTVTDVDDALRTAETLGARVVVEPTALDGGGRYAVLADPQGATIGIYSADDIPPERAPDPGEFSWHELGTTDYRAAFDFYSELFGWEKIREPDVGPTGVYLIFGRGDTELGGIYDKDAGDPAWLSYVRVTDLAATLDKLEAARGSVQNGPMDVPNGDRIAQVLDPYGAAFALHVVAADAAPSSGGDTNASDADESDADAALRSDGGTTAEYEARSTPVWTDAPAEETAPEAVKAAKEKRATKKAATRTPAGEEAPPKKAARRKTANKKAAKKKAAKKASAQKATKAKTTSTKGKRTTKASAGKKTAKKSKKKTAKKTAKKAAKKAAKKTAKKTTKTAKKTTKKTAKKSQRRPAKRTAKKTRAKKAAKKRTAKATRKKAAKKKPTKKSR